MNIRNNDILPSFLGLCLISATLIPFLCQGSKVFFPFDALILFPVIAVLLWGIFLRRSFSRRISSIHFTTVDILIVAVIIYSVVHILVCPSYADPANGYKWGVFVLTYLSVRCFRNVRNLLYSIIVAGTLQSVIAGLQSFGYLSSFHEFFNVTGTFINPGLLGGFVAFAVILSGWFLSDGLQKRHVRLIAIFTVTLVINGYVLVRSDSRAAWFIVIGALAYWIYNSLKTRISHMVLLTAIGTSLVLLLCASYFYKPSSANGRILINRVGIEVVAQRPVFGHGIGSFGSMYMPAQAHYFRTHPGSSLANVADNVLYPCNEYLQILVEMGLVGLITDTYGTA